MEQRKHPAQFQNEQEWQEALKGRFEGLHGKIAELIGEKNSLQAKCERYEGVLMEIENDSTQWFAHYLKNPKNNPIAKRCREALSAGEGGKGGRIRMYKIMFGLQDHHVKRIEEERKRWNDLDIGERATEKQNDAIYIHAFWMGLAKEFSWEPLTMALWYFRFHYQSVNQKEEKQ